MWLKVSDDGAGIPLGERAGVFGGGRAGLGLGLGLGLSRDLARAMDGDLVCSEPLRAGATFTLTLPASQDPVVKPVQGTEVLPDEDRMLSPRARLLVDMTVALAERSLDRAIAGCRHCVLPCSGRRPSVLAYMRIVQACGKLGSTGDVVLAADDVHLKWVVEHRQAHWERNWTSIRT